MFAITFQRKKILIHLVFWMGFSALFVFFWSTRLEFTDALIRSVLFTSLEAGITYLNLLVLIPVFFMKKKYFRYILICCLLVITSVLLSIRIDPVPLRSDEQRFERWNRERNLLSERDSLKKLQQQRLDNSEKPKRMKRLNARPRQDIFVRMARQARVFFNGLLTIAVILMSTAIGVSQIAFKKEREATEFKSEKIKAEMKFLKSQINPHFLFNALNSAYTLAYIKADEAPEVILKLSDMLRYLIYDCEADQVLVS
ncbi:MAG: histidine kinase, partial [Bacteroidota bacterium]